MLLSFPIGPYIIFNSDTDDEINYEFPLQEFDLFLAGLSFSIPIDFVLGDAFVIFWSIYAILFSIAMLGPKHNLLSSVSNIVTKGKINDEENYLVSIIKWFSILILVSGIINYAQEIIGITIEPPHSESKLMLLFDVTKAPLIEEIAFRTLLIGLPLFVMYSPKSSLRHFFKAMWHPSPNLHVLDHKRVIVLVAVVAIFFGISHIISGEPWSGGKVAQATAGGIILGWIYFRHGLLPAILIHWATNYFIFSYVYLVAGLNTMSIQEAFSHPLLDTLEILFLITGVLASSLLIIKFIIMKKKLEV